MEKGDVEEYTGVIVDFDRLTKLDTWKTALLLKLKKTIQADEEDFT